jgi:hypothetical protein
MEVIVAGITVNVAVAVTRLGAVAVTWVVPVATAVAVPVESMVATFAELVVQVTERVRSAFVPSEKVAVAVKWTVVAARTWAADGVT